MIGIEPDFPFPFLVCSILAAQVEAFRMIRIIHIILPIDGADFLSNRENDDDHWSMINPRMAYNSHEISLIEMTNLLYLKVGVALSNVAPSLLE